jgi:hypothetical protein
MNGTRTFVIGYRHDQRLGLWQHHTINIDALTCEEAEREFEKAYPNRVTHPVDYIVEASEQDHG